MDYNNRPRKRLAQQYLLSHLPYFSDTLLCLSGPSDSFNNIYIPMMKNYGLTNIFGFDLNEKGPNICNNDIVYAVTIMAHKYQKPFIVDADFCRSYKNDGYNLAIIVATMKAMIPHGAVLWTFGMEYIKDNDLFEFLNKRIYNNSLVLHSKRINSRGLWEQYHSQSKFKKSIIIGYKDGSPMKTGLLVW